MDSVLIVGSGGREHALLKGLLRSDRALCLYAHPGNPGMENDGCMVVDKTVQSWDDLADWAVANGIDLTVVGPEVPLVEGLVDALHQRGLKAFGPSKKAARIEGSKAFSKNLMKKYGIPTAAFEVFTEKKAAVAYVKAQGVPVVVKVSGLAAGKGAIVCDTEEEALQALDLVFDKKAFGSAGGEVVIEEKMVGEEASVFVLTDGKTHRILPVSQDHKAIGDGDKGPNTGGMGAYAPAPLVDNELLKQVEEKIVVPTLEAMKKEGAPYMGLLYCGIMVTDQGPEVVEYNCRFGDPETQAVLPLLNCDLFELLMACATGKLHSAEWSVKQGYCVNIVLASEGYPGSYEKGKKITGLEEAERNRNNVDVYHAGTLMEGDGLVTNGGRVLSVSAWADTLEEAIAEGYGAAGKIEFAGKTLRHDIGMKGLARLKAQKKSGGVR